MSIATQKIIPSGVEVLAVGFLTALVIGIGNSGRLISYYGLSSSTHVIKTSTSDAINHGLAKLDDLSFTRFAVTFGIWALVGLLSLSFVRAIGSVYKEIEFEEEVSSRRYIHPRTFTRARFWKQVLLEFLGFSGYFIVLAGLLYCFAAFVLPVGLTYSRGFLLDISLGRLAGLGISIFIIFMAMLVIYTFIKLFINRRHLFDRNAI